ncbi:MAG: T9SS type A sorting domain-containing protein, partial [candidate division WOR-3 bacterium]
WGIAWNYIQNRIYVANSLSSSVSVIGDLGIEEISKIDFGNKTLEAYPNPFRKEIQIRFMMHDTGNRTQDKVGQGFSLAIYDVSGRVVKSFSRLTVNGERSTVVWDGSDNSGRKLPSGVYFVRLNADHHSATKKVILIE